MGSRELGDITRQSYGRTVGLLRILNVLALISSRKAWGHNPNIRWRDRSSSVSSDRRAFVEGQPCHAPIGQYYGEDRARNRQSWCAFRGLKAKSYTTRTDSGEVLRTKPITGGCGCFLASRETAGIHPVEARDRRTLGHRQRRTRCWCSIPALARAARSHQFKPRRSSGSRVSAEETM